MKRLPVLILLCLLPLMAHAKHLFEFGIHAGAATLTTSPVYVERRFGWHAGAQLCYTWISPQVVGLRTGVTIDCHRTGILRNDYQDAYSTIDVENEQMDIAYSIGTLTERYTTWSAAVPLQLVFAYRRFSLQVGPKAVLAFSGSWQQTADNAALSVYYPDYDNIVLESFPIAASRNFRMEQNGSLTPPLLQWWLAAEFCYMQPVRTARRHRSYLVFGVYFDYCFSSLPTGESHAESLIMLTDTRDGFPLRRILTPVYLARRQGDKLLSDHAPLDFGIKLSYAISPYDASTSSSTRCRCLR